MADDKTEQASPRRKQKARERGDIFQSRELTGALGMGAGVLVMGALVIPFATGWQAAYRKSIDMGIHRDLSLRDGAVVNELAHVSLLHTAVPVVLVLVATLGAALLAGLVQAGGVQFHMEALQWKPDRLLPATNLKNIFSARAGLRMLKSLIPAAMVMVLGADVLEHSVLSMPAFSLAELPVMFASQYHLLLAASGILLAWSALDYLVEWRSWEKRLRMSREEMRQEYKEMEGNPQIRSRIRSLQRQMRRRKMQADVSRATVVITNPTHYAVALEFDFDTMQAPRVLAKGRNLMAQQIKEEARWAGVPIVENPPLARSLYRTVEPGQAIPQDLYAAVAAILAFLYRQRVEEARRREEGRRGVGHPGTKQRGERPPRVSAARWLEAETGPGLEDAEPTLRNSSENPNSFGTAGALFPSTTPAEVTDPGDAGAQRGKAGEPEAEEAGEDA